MWKPSTTVAAVIERHGRFLLVEERIEGRLVLNQPAGHLDPHESLVAACRREVLEETAHRFEPTALVGIYRWHYPAKDVTFLRFCFRGRIEGTEARGLDKEIIRLHWLARDELFARRPEHRSPLVQRCVDDYIAGRAFSLEILSSEYA
jgi:8-oxo-dGTP pyrophosphatase MutT (NUDIX family)